MERWYDIGEQVVFEILLYLPIMSLLRFKSVCQSWFAVIESSTFMREHLKYRRREKGESMIIFGEDDVNARGQLPVLSGSQYEDCTYIDCEQLLWHPVKESECIGSCHGIVCVHHRNGTWSDGALWNPALKQLRRLPQPLLPCDGHMSQYHTALGIDAAGDFKVVRIMWTYSKEWYEEDSVLLGNKAEVYSLRDNSWRITHEDDALLFKIFPCLATIWAMPVLLGGKCFWVAHDHHYSMMLLSFDFDDEVFGTMALPGLDSTDYCYYHYLDSCDDKLVCIRVQSYNDIYEVWILHEYGVHESWNRLYSPELGRIHVLGLSWNAEFLIAHKFDGCTNRLYLYNLKTQQGHFLQSVHHSITAYTPSLFSLTSANAH